MVGVFRAFAGRPYGLGMSEVGDWLKWILIAVVGGAVVLVLERSWDGIAGRLPWRRPDFVWSRANNGDWWLTRTRGRTALEVGVGIGSVSADGDRLGDEVRISGGRTFGDMAAKTRRQAATDGEQVFVVWIERDRRWYGKSELLTADRPTVEVRRRPARRGVPVNTLEP